MKVYLVQYSSGEYEDYRSWVKFVCSSKEKAEEKVKEWSDKKNAPLLFDSDEHRKIEDIWEKYEYRDDMFSVAVKEGGFDCTLEEYENFEERLYDDEHLPEIIEMGVL